MFKLVVLSVFVAVAAAHPGLYASAPLAYSAPALTTVHHEPAYAHVGSIIKSVPSAVSHQSHSVVHSSAHVVQDVIAPAVKTTSYTTKTLATPVITSYAAPVISSYAAAPVLKTYSAPLVHTYAAAASPVVYKSW